jgi:hypothetical protein
MPKLGHNKDEQYILYSMKIPYQKQFFKTQQYQYQTDTKKNSKSKNISGNIVYYSINDLYNNTANYNILHVFSEYITLTFPSPSKDSH